MNNNIAPTAFFKFSYGLFVLTTNTNSKDFGCIINTAMLLTDNPKRISIAVNQGNFTNQMIKESGIFNVSILNQTATFDIFKQFGFQSGRDVDKFKGIDYTKTSQNGVKYIDNYANAFISAKVVGMHDYGTHTVFVGEVTQAENINEIPSVTYDYYFKNIKPKPAPQKKKGYVCKICGYFYEGHPLPSDFICPICKHGADDFEYVEM